MIRTLAAALSLSLLAARTEAADSRFDSLRTWSGPSALTVPEGRTEIGLLREGRYGVTDRVELGLHPLFFFVLPHVELKARAITTERTAFAVRGRLSYPTPFLRLVSREGSGGLLPNDSEPPFSLQFEGDAIATALLDARTLATLSLGIAVAPHTSFTEAELPLLDFPFLYARFAPLYTVAVPRAAVHFDGHVVSRLFVELELRAYLVPELPYVGTALALEQALSFEFRFSEHVALGLGARFTEAEYPVGYRMFFLPYVDLRVGF